MKKPTLEQLEKAIREHTGHAVVITDFTNTNRKPDFAPKGLPYSGGITAGNTVYFSDESAMDLKSVQSHEPTANPPTVLKTAQEETLRQKVLGRWRG